MKVYAELEASDIDFKDPVHSFLLAQIMFLGLSMSDVGTQTKKLAEAGITGEDALVPIKGLIAETLNHAQKAGISITKSELPSAFAGVPK